MTAFQHCTGNRDTCPCHRHSNLRSFYSDGPTDAYGSRYDSVGNRYKHRDPQTMMSNHEKQEIRVYGYSLRR